MTDKTTEGTTSRAIPRPARMHGRFHAQLLPWLVLAVSLAVTYQLWRNAQHNAVQVLQTQFDYRVRDVAREVSKRMETYEQVMRGVDGLFAHASIVERGEFRDYVAKLRLKENYPGIQGIRFVPIVPKTAKDRHIAAVRKEGLSGYTIWPEGQRDIYAPVVYAEPFDIRNQQVFGYDMLSDRDSPLPGDSVGMRRAAMEQARDSDNAALSGKIKLLFDADKDTQPGLVMFLPVYKHDAPHDTLAERRASIVGWICSVFRMGDLMAGIGGEDGGDFDFDLYDGEEVSGKTVLYDPHTRPTNIVSDSRFQETRRIAVADHTWTMVALSLPGFEARLDTEKLWVVANSGIGVSILLAFLTWLLVYGRERAMQSAAAVERASRKNEMLLRTASDGIYIFDLDGNVMQVNEALCRMLGCTQEKILGVNVAQWNAQWPKEELLTRINALNANNPVFETLFRRCDGGIIDVEVSASRVEIDGRQVIYNSARDITERKKTEAAFHTIAGTAVANVGAAFYQETTSSLSALLEADCVIVGKLVDGNRIRTLGMQLDGKAIEHYEYALSGAPCEIAIREGYCEYPENVCQLFPLDIELVNMGAEAYAGAPTRDKNGKVNGILCAIFRHKLAPQSIRKEVMEIIADRAGAEIEREEAERALRESEERWGFALEGSGDGVWDWDLQTGKIVFSRRYKEILGFPGDANWDSLGEWKDRVNLEDMMRAMVDLEAYLDGKLPTYTVEYRMSCRDGSWKWLLARGMVVARAEDGRPMRMIGTHTDITERKQAEEAIHQSEAQLRLLLDSAAEAIYGIDGDGNCTFCNPSCLRMLGYQHADELIGKNMHRLIHHKHADETPFPVEECRIYQAFQRGANIHVDDEVFWRADGSFFPAEYWSHPQLHDGAVTGAVVTFLDISERLQANEKLLKLSRAVENSPASVVITNVDGTIEYVNRRFTQVTGYLPEEAIGQNPRVLNAGIHPKEFYQEMWATILAGKEWEGEIYNKKKSGEIYLEHAFISPIRDDKGAATHFVAVKEDITKRKQTEQELQKAMAAAEAASRAKGDFLANMSHEIRTPMNAIIGLSHLCLQTELTAKQKDYLHKVHGSAKSLLGIINDVLDFSKIEAGKMDVELVRFELEDVMGNLATVVSAKAEEKGLEFLFETSLDVYPHLIGDPLRLGQVLINLVGNAVKFTDKGEVLVLAEVEEETADEVVLLFTVRDTGIGMTREQAGKLFQAFTQADATTTRKFGGTGLGLSISKRIVGLMNGKIWVESTPGRGSKFIFTARFGKAVERRTGKRNLPNVELQGIRVLAVDDNATSRHILQSYLESFTFGVTMATNGLEALQAVEQADREGMPYQFVILDWKMPGMDGIEAARKIREMAGLSQMPKILLISSFSQSDMLQHVEDDVVDGILAKPFLQSELFNATLEIFGRAEARVKRGAATALFHPDLVAKISGAYLLLAEDNEINQQVARELLEKAGVTVAIAENGEEALTRLWEEKFDGVLMDMQMPVMDGITATREIRKNPRFADLPIIAMTANVLAGDLDQCLAAGMNDHITKPLDPNQMVATLAKWITPAQPAALPAASGQEAGQGPRVVQGLETLPNLPGVRVAEGVRRMGDSVAGYCAILEKFRSGQQNTLAEIRSAMTANDLEEAERLAHTLKGLLGTLGAGKLQDKAGELEIAIRGRVNVQVESLLLVVDAELSRLLTAIDRALDLRAAKKMENAEVAATTGPVNMEELAGLMRQAKSQLEQFDSSVEDTVARMRRMVGGDAAMKQALASVERCVSSYNYEQGLAELTACAKSMDISCEGV